MALSAFADKAKQPDEAALREVLGRSSVHWQAIVDALARDYPPLDLAWQHGGAKWGWTLRLRQKKRTIVYLTPGQSHFVAGFAVGEKAAQAARRAGLSPALLRAVATAPRYAEGRAVRLDVRNRQDRADVLGLAAVKMAN